jgi:shikimate kinase
VNHSNLYLIGYRCTGKSSVGNLLATTLGRSFVDTDSMIVAENGMSIRQMVNSRGWGAFRKLEHAVLQRVGIVDRQVVATGGGIVLDRANIELMKGRGRVVWLRATADTIKIRMAQDQASEGFRPALTVSDSISEIEETLAERQPLYQRAMDFAVDTDNLRLDAIADFIIENLTRINRKSKK